MTTVTTHAAPGTTRDDLAHCGETPSPDPQGAWHCSCWSSHDGRVLDPLSRFLFSADNFRAILRTSPSMVSWRRG